MDGDVSHRIGIMQGRLLPPVNGQIQAFPRERWQEEFPLASRLGFSAIEFIFDVQGEAIRNHPLLENGCQSMRATTKEYGVGVKTICADYFMKHPFHSTDSDAAEESLEILAELISQCRILGVTDIVIPCVDQSRLKEASDRQILVRRLRSVVPLCESAGVNLALETDLEPAEFRRLLEHFDSRRVTINYDVGNSASLGYNPVEEWRAYGDRVSSVHIKDRLLHGPTVALGTGAARFQDFFRVAKESGYKGLFILQGARGSDNIATAVSYKAFVEQCLKRIEGEENGTQPQG